MIDFLSAHFSNSLAWWPWAILAVLPPAVILLYFLKLKRRPVEVPSTWLWAKSIEDLHVNSIWQRLRRNLLLLLQLLILLLAAAALLRPSLQGRRLSGARFLFLIDNSASMQATDVGPSRLDEAKRLAGEMIDEMRSGEVAMVLSFSDTARVEQVLTDDRRQLHRSVEAIRPTQRSTSLAEAMRVASGMAAESRGDEEGAKAASLYIFSDGKFPAVEQLVPGNLKLTFVPVGSKTAKNVGIAAFRVGRNDAKPDELQAFGRVVNCDSTDTAASVELYLDDRLMDADQLEVPAGESRGVAFDLGAVDQGSLRLKVTADDDLQIDDEAAAVLSALRPANVLLVTPGNSLLESALETRQAGELGRVAIEPVEFLENAKYASQSAAGDYDLVIFDRCRPKRSPRCHTVYFGSLPPDGGWSSKPKVNVPQIIDAESLHPLMQWVDMGDVVIYEATPLQLPAGTRVLIDSDQGPLCAIGPRESFEDLVFGFGIVEDGKLVTNWPTRQSFPTFLLNMFSYMGGGRRGLSRQVVHPGTPVTLQGPKGSGRLRVIPPGGIPLDITTDASGKAPFAETELQGVYRVESDGQPVEQFAVNLFDSQESDICPSLEPEIQIGQSTAAVQASSLPARRELWKWVLLAGLVVLLWEWYIYNHRVHV